MSDNTYWTVVDPETRKPPKCQKCQDGELALDRGCFGGDWKMVCDKCGHSYPVDFK